VVLPGAVKNAANAVLVSTGMVIPATVVVETELMATSTPYPSLKLGVGVDGVELELLFVGSVELFEHPVKMKSVNANRIIGVKKHFFIVIKF
jgi:hypothetical protein